MTAYRDAQEAEWLCFLDADDELDSLYIEAMRWSKGFRRGGAETEHLLAPAVSFVDSSISIAPPVLPNRNQPMDVLNHCVIGTLVSRDLFGIVGGFHEWEAYEDWELWLRCIRAGAEVMDVPGAIYRAWRHEGRNSQPQSVLTAAYNAIRSAHAGAL